MMGFPQNNPGAVSFRLRLHFEAEGRIRPEVKLLADSFRQKTRRTRPAKQHGGQENILFHLGN